MFLAPAAPLLRGGEAGESADIRLVRCGGAPSGLVSYFGMIFAISAPPS